MLLHITGGAYTHSSIDVNNQRSVNMLPTEIGQNGLGMEDPTNAPNQEGVGKGALVRAPGNKLLIDLGGFECRGLFTILNKYVYTVVDSKLWQLVIDAKSRVVVSSTFIGNLMTYTGPVHMVNNKYQLMIVDSSQYGYIYMQNTYGTTTMGTIGGSVGNTYTLTINGTNIYNNANVTTSPTAAQVIAQINLSTSTTHVTASSGGNNVVNLVADGPNTITISESGSGFTQGTNGLTVAGFDFQHGSVSAFQTIGAEHTFYGGNRIVYNDGYFLYNQVATNYVWCSGLNSGAQWNGLSYFTAETKPCIVKGISVNKGEVWIFGDTVTEVWYDAANAPPGSPYSYRVGSGMDIGCIAPHSIVEMELINIWLDSRGFVAVSDISPYIRNNNSGYDMRIISTPALQQEWANYERIDDAIGTYLIDRGQIMYMISFPTAQKTWVYAFPTRPMRMGVARGEWHERTYLNPTSNAEEYYLIQYNTRFEQMNIAGGSRSGKIYDFSSKYYDDDGAPIKCTRTVSPFSDEFKNIGIDALKLRLQTGTALESGNGSDPKVMLRYSNDGSHTWSQPLIRSMGKIGEYNKPIEWNRLGSAPEWVFEFTVQDAIDFAIIKAAIKVTTEEDQQY